MYTVCTYICIVRFTWDSAKATQNLRKHDVDFADAVIALEDLNAITVEDTGALGEARFVTTGMDPGGRIIVVVYTYRDASGRLISARPATRSEKIIYEKGIRLQ